MLGSPWPRLDSSPSIRDNMHIQSRNTAVRSSYHYSMKLELFDHRLPACRRECKRFHKTSRIVSSIVISALQAITKNKADSRVFTHEGPSKSASKTASRFVQSEFDSSLSAVRLCYTRVPAPAKLGYGGISVRFLPSPPNLTACAAMVCESSTDECQRKCQQDLTLACPA